jgi:hypothetical protein
LRALLEANVTGGMNTTTVTNKQTGTTRAVVGHAFLVGERLKMKVLRYCPVCGGALNAETAS